EVYDVRYNSSLVETFLKKETSQETSVHQKSVRQEIVSASSSKCLEEVRSKRTRCQSMRTARVNYALPH
ncbi:hypothetical protein KIN20_027553, partial [Parelaphostrongylus tenuis]